MSNRIKEEFLQKSEPVRLNKYLSEAGVCSRREADRLIETGRVTVDGQRAQTGMRIVPGQVVKVGNKVVSKQDEMIVLAVNKPRGIVCTEERRERDSIVRFLNYPVRVTYIGRLDKDSHGLLLMTNNGDIINKMMRAANKHEKEYKVTVDKEITEDFLKKMAAGVPILDTVTRPCTVKKIGKYTFSIILTQGLNRQIRRMCEALGYEVKDLLRVRVMNITLDGLKDGQYRKLTDQELNELYDQLKDSSALPGGKYQEQWAATQDNRTDLYFFSPSNSPSVPGWSLSSRWHKTIHIAPKDAPNEEEEYFSHSASKILRSLYATSSVDFHQ